ncbi:MAG: molybdopterin-dependent oxidoreductase [Gammaproteobacteria bacterium]|nr:molybdopterin-dependent oxidoreductase [Gammaproteobacteria bacterium]
MNDIKVNRRGFLKALGWGGAGTALTACDLPTTITLEEGKEEVVAYVVPEEYVIPGIGVWYASTCTQCDAGCGLHGRVREGRILKVEGNPDSLINNGSTCLMGQAGVQNHYNPDRVTQPMMRKGAGLQPISWDDAMAELSKRIKSTSGSKIAWVSGSVSGHQSVLISEFLSSVGSKNHFAHETINSSVWSQVCADMIGDAEPRLRLDKAQIIVSFGADFLGTWKSPVHFAGEYAKFRSGQRGMLVQVEPKMTLTGGNADLWIAANPGTEGALALGVANFILDRGWNKENVPGTVKQALAAYDVDTVAGLTGVPATKIQRIASLFSERAPSLAIAGATVEGQANGYDAASAVMLLNIIMGNIGNTIEAGNKFPERALRAKSGNTGDLVKFAQGLEDKKFDLLFFSNSNPVYTAPDALRVKENLSNASFKVALTQHPDETALAADLVLPLYSSMEDWGSHVPAYQPEKVSLSIQQPLMEPLYKDTRGFGDVMLSLLKVKSNAYNKFPDYYSYLKTAMVNMPESVRSGLKGSRDQMWTNLLQNGVLNAGSNTPKLTPKPRAIKAATVSKNSEYPMHLVPSARLGLWDGRHANIPWLQEAPDQISKVVWGSWAELHPSTAGKLGVQNGDFIRVSSASGSIETQVYVHKGIHPNVVAVPMGQGHSAYGRYAKDRGVNPLKILDAVSEEKTGELALYATRVKVTKTNKSEVLVKMGGSETQLGRGFVRTVSADQFRRTEGEA